MENCVVKFQLENWLKPYLILYSPIHTCDSERNFAVIWWRTCVCSCWYIRTTRQQRRFIFVLFYLHYPKILRAQPKMFEDCQSKLGLFMWSRNPPSTTEDARGLSKQIRFTKNFKSGLNSESQSDCETMTSLSQIALESQPSHISNRRCEWGLSQVSIIPINESISSEH